MEFIAVDVETANADIASICAIGLVHFRDGQVLRTFSMLINPEDHFDEVNIGIHGIRPEDVALAPTIEKIYPQLSQTLCPSIVVHHTHFDRSAFHKVSLRHRLPDLTCRWLDSSSIARRAWPDCAKKGYGLADLGKKLNITFKHHDATEDARAAGEIVIKAIAATGIGLDQWLALVSQPSKSTASALDHEPRVARDGNPDGPLYGEVIAFTGRLSIERERAARLAAKVAGAGTLTVDATVIPTPAITRSTFELRLSDHPSDIRDAARTLAKAIADQIGKLQASKPNGEDDLKKHNEYVGFLEKLASGLKELADALDRVATAKAKGASEPIFIGTAGKIAEQLSTDIKKWFEEHHTDSVDFFMSATVFAAGYDFLAACGVQGGVAAIVSGLLTKSFSKKKS